MDQGNPAPSSTRKPKFIPKVPKRRPPPRRSESSRRGEDEDDALESERLLKMFQERTQRSKPTTARRSSARVAFGGGAPATSSSGISIGSGKDAVNGNHPYDFDESMKDATDSSNSDKEEVYREPWNYETSYYPTTLPLRRPYSGDPGILDEAEFGEKATKTEYDETKLNAAKELGLLAENGNNDRRFVFFQLPPVLPLSKESIRNGKEKMIVEISDSPDKKTKEPSSVNSTQTGAGQTLQVCSSWRDLPSGPVGKMLVYKSGKVKLKIGDTLYDVIPGSQGEASEDATIIDLNKKHCCRLGAIEKHAVVSVDVDSILDKVSDEKL